MSKQTAVEWLETKVNGMIENGGDADLLAVIEHIKQAKEMEKEQIIFAHVSSCNTMNCNKTDKEKLKCSCGQYFWEQNFK
jgi:hypothetical protein